MSIEILFIGKTHFPNDPRVCYRVISLLKDKFKKNICIHWLDVRNESSNDDIYKKIDNYIKYDNVINLVRFIKKNKIDVIQVSDPRELKFLIVGLLCNVKILIYDSHEDYYHQVLTINKKNRFRYLKAFLVNLFEILCSVISTYVFTTDKYILQKLKRYNKRTYLMRNYPYLDKMRFKKSGLKKENIVKLVYIGSYNKTKGVDDVINFVKRLNKARSDIKYELHIYTRVKYFPDIRLSGNIILHDYLEYDQLIDTISEYHIGVCLWHDTKKNNRNIPIKVFDYISAGLPIIGSKVKNIKEIVNNNSLGCVLTNINYFEFVKAVEEIMNRYDFYRGCVAQSLQKKSFEIEAENYLEIFKDV